MDMDTDPNTLRLYQPPLPLWDDFVHDSSYVCVKLSRSERGRSCMRPRGTEMGWPYGRPEGRGSGETQTVGSLRDVHNLIRAADRTLDARIKDRRLRGRHRYRWIAMETGYSYEEVKAAL